MKGQKRCFPDQKKKKKAKRINLHQTRMARYGKGTALRSGRKTVRVKGTKVQRE